MVRPLTRRRFLIGLASAGMAAAGGGIYTRFGEPHWLEVSRIKISLPGAPVVTPPIRLVHLSDLHASPVVSFELIDRAVTLALAERPDVIALTGDFFTNRVQDA